MDTFSKTITRKVLPALLLLLLVQPLITVSADMGPKPWMDFPISWESGTPQEITSVALYTCSDPSCSDPRPLEELGPQHISCESNNLCTSMAYGYDLYFQLELGFADGQTMSSRVIEYSGSGSYPVIVTGEELLIEVPEPGFLEKLLNIPPADRGSMPFESPFGIALMLMVVVVLLASTAVILGGSTLLVILIRRANKEDINLQNATVPFILIWIAAGFFFLGGILLSPTMPLTAIIEGIAALVYATLRKRDRTATLTIVLLANLLTIPVLVISAVLFGFGSFSFVTLAAEILIWLVEAVVLFVLQRRIIKFQEALLLSLGLNLLSFLTGLLLPF
ncbi:MAG: hypothetical protein JXA25_13235 [Anaerolineales bacterium]|nr:hypothetical protein [Anaerolineales bacterium]